MKKYFSFLLLVALLSCNNSMLLPEDDVEHNYEGNLTRSANKDALSARDLLTDNTTFTNGELVCNINSKEALSKGISLTDYNEYINLLNKYNEEFEFYLAKGDVVVVNGSQFSREEAGSPLTRAASSISSLQTVGTFHFYILGSSTSISNTNIHFIAPSNINIILTSYTHSNDKITFNGSGVSNKIITPSDPCCSMSHGSGNNVDWNLFVSYFSPITIANPTPILRSADIIVTANLTTDTPSPGVDENPNGTPTTIVPASYSIHSYIHRPTPDSTVVWRKIAVGTTDGSAFDGPVTTYIYRTTSLAYEYYSFSPFSWAELDEIEYYSFWVLFYMKLKKTDGTYYNRMFACVTIPKSYMEPIYINCENPFEEEPENEQ